MRHHTAVYVELESGKGWHYASLSRRGGHPLGHCSEHPPHETERDARVCYRIWQRENVEPHGTWSWGNCNVDGCKNPANKGWHVRGDGYLMAILCADHDDAEHALNALGLLEAEAGDAWQS